MLRKIFYLSIVLALANSGCVAGPNTDTDTERSVDGQADALRKEKPESLDLDLTLRGEAAVKVRLNTYEGSCHGARSTVLAVPGFAATGATYAPLAHAILSDATLRQNVKRVITIDFPGHGGSGVPKDVRFGDLTIDDEVDVLVQALHWLSDHDRAPDAIIGHSLGGLVVQAAQERLLSEGSSLSDLGVRDAALLAPVPPHAQHWTLPPVTSLQQFIVSDAARGDTLQLPPLVWVLFVFATRSGLPALDAPFPSTALLAGYIASEPAATLFQLLEASVPVPDGGSIALERPSVREGAFASERGTRLHVVAFSEDTLVPAADVHSLATYLSAGDDSVVSDLTTPFAAHGAYISEPLSVKDELQEALQ